MTGAAFRLKYLVAGLSIWLKEAWPRLTLSYFDWSLMHMIMNCDKALRKRVELISVLPYAFEKPGISGIIAQFIQHIVHRFIHLHMIGDGATGCRSRSKMPPSHMKLVLQARFMIGGCSWYPTDR